MAVEKKSSSSTRHAGFLDTSPLARVAGVPRTGPLAYIDTPPRVRQAIATRKSLPPTSRAPLKERSHAFNTSGVE